MKIVRRLCAIALSLLLTGAAAVCAGEAEDRALAARVKDALGSDANLNNLFMQPEAADGTVTLTGRAVSPENRELAEKIARGVKGVRNVENKLTVKPLDTDDIATLSAMKQRAVISQQFSRNPPPESAAASPQYFSDQKNYYRNLDKMSLHMDKNIYDNISDRDIKTQVEIAVRQAPTIGRTNNITVMVQSGRVTLIGTVDCYQDHYMITDVAARVPGVVSVDNETYLSR